MPRLGRPIRRAIERMWHCNRAASSYPSAARVNLPAGQFAAAHVDLQLAGVLGEPARAEAWQADGPALRAAIATAGDALVPEARRLVVDQGHMPAPLA